MTDLIELSDRQVRIRLIKALKKSVTANCWIMKEVNLGLNGSYVTQINPFTTDPVYNE
jgi:hypothetical protein